MLALPSSAALAEDTIKIGLIAPFSGPFAEYGKRMESGIKTYMKQHGDRAAGTKMELILRDSGPGARCRVQERAGEFGQGLKLFSGVCHSFKQRKCQFLSGEPPWAIRK
jgi:hypothetical protein